MPPKSEDPTAASEFVPEMPHLHEGVPTTAGLGAEDWSRADRVARRLHSELAAFLSGLPPSVRHASALARHLDVDRTTCQRTVHAATRPYSGPQLLVKLPGVRALRMLAEASTRTEPPADAEAVDALVAAIDQVHALVAELGGSMSRFSKRLTQPKGQPARVNQPTERGPLDARRRLSDAATEITGRSSACWVAVYAYRPSPDDPDKVEVFRANGLVGHVARPDAVPLVVHNFSSGADGDPVDGLEPFASLEDAHLAGSSPTVVLDQFCSSPPPLVTARQPDEFLVQSIDPQAPSDHPVDLMLATRTVMPHPRLQEKPVEEVWALVNFPSRHLILDVWLHKDLARACLPSLDTHLWTPDFAQGAADRWRTRFAESPVLQLLGSGLPRHAPPAYPRHNELTAHLFDRTDLDLEQFIGHRCDVSYPIWRTGYCMRLDYTPPESSEG
jgi:hypothetical protein